MTNYKTETGLVEAVPSGAEAISCDGYTVPVGSGA